MNMDLERFEELVAEAIEGLPQPFLDALDNVAILVEDWPSWHALASVGVRRREDLLGLYEGIPQTGRNSGYTLVPPDKITIFRYPILMRCRTEDQVRALVQRVVRHEIAHHFGIDDDRLIELGAY